MKRIKRILSMALVGSLLLGLTACGGQAAADPGPDETPSERGQAVKIPAHNYDPDESEVPEAPDPGEPVGDTTGTNTPYVIYPEYALFHCDQKFIEKAPVYPDEDADDETFKAYSTAMSVYRATMDERKKNVDFDTFRPRFLNFASDTSLALMADADGQENFVYSPLSFYAAMCMLAGAVDGDEKAEILDFLNADDYDMVKQAAYTMFYGLTKNDDQSRLGVADSVWFNDKLVPAPHEKNKRAEELCNDFFASAYAVPFGQPEANQAVTGWIEQMTDKMIHMDFDFNEDLSMVLVNALYYKDTWYDEFPEQDTKDGDFHTASGETVTVPLMHRSDTGSYYETEDYTIASLGAFSGSVRFLLPKDPNADIKTIMSDENTLKTLCDEGLWENADTVKQSLIHWTVPRMDVLSSLNLTSVLKTLGVDVLEKDLDTEALVGVKSQISSILQQARIKADEKGFEAAAATVISMETSGLHEMPPQEIYMTLDRPFGLVIMSEDVPLFVSYVTNPMAK